MRKNGFSTERVFFVSDTHFVPKLKGNLRSDSGHDAGAISIALQAQKDFCPDRIVHLGDILDLHGLSRWAKQAGGEGQILGSDKKYHHCSYLEQLKLVTTWWEYHLDAYPNAGKHQLEGNHDFRSFDYFSNSSKQMLEDLTLRNLPIWKKIKYHPYNRSDDETVWLKLNSKLKALHGYGNGNVLKRLRDEHDNVVCGHVHRVDEYGTSKNSNGRKECVSVGCLSNKVPDYATHGGAESGYEHGFATGYISGDDYQIDGTRIIDGKVLNFNGKEYRTKRLSEIDKRLSIFE